MYVACKLIYTIRCLREYDLRLWFLSVLLMKIAGVFVTMGYSGCYPSVAHLPTSLWPESNAWCVVLHHAISPGPH